MFPANVAPEPVESTAIRLTCWLGTLQRTRPSHTPLFASPSYGSFPLAHRLSVAHGRACPESAQTSPLPYPGHAEPSIPHAIAFALVLLLPLSMLVCPIFIHFGRFLLLVPMAGCSHPFHASSCPAWGPHPPRLQSAASISE
ncbi:hypothetical protein HDV57DRAFT_414882 [Trichoderma longibrachiatum]|uniref:Uncharacterized protein n=1 Tax=Trichoderma longibrachiatum ATCC 18648 TaxID=983965 RepID=A0A2T4C2P9_TRILO|nr:hypothetical protein M440DRAFT_1262526 [Trichoderma longibrachiatum ATCC 18648]